MNVPTKELEWQFNINQQVGSLTWSGDYSSIPNATSILYAIKNSLKGFAQNPWTVIKSAYRSSSSTTSELGDIWTDSNFLWNGSWILLKNINGVQLLMSTKGGPYSIGDYAPHRLYIALSPSGNFTNVGTNVPTSIDAINLRTGNSNDSEPWGVAKGVTSLSYLHIIHDTTGKHTRIILTKAGSLNAFVCISQVTVHSSVIWTNPIIGMWAATAGTNSDLVNQIFSENVIKGYMGTEKTMIPSHERWAGNTTITSRTTAMTTTNTWALGNIIGLWTSAGKVAVSSNGSRSVLPDVLLGSTTNPTGTTYLDESGQKVWAQFGGLVVPWNNTTLQVA